MSAPGVNHLKPIVRKVRTLLRVLTGSEFLVARDVRLPTESFGFEGVDWEILTDGVDAQSVVYSFGVGEDISFDLALIERFGVTVHAFDPTPRSIEWVGRQSLPPSFVLHEYGIGGADGHARFHPPADPRHVSHSVFEISPDSGAITVPIKTLTTILAELRHPRVDILKLNIEGAEFDVIEQIARSDVRPRQIVVELHHRFPGAGIEKSRTAIATLRRLGYRIFWVSPANAQFGFLYSR